MSSRRRKSKKQQASVPSSEQTGIQTQASGTPEPTEDTENQTAPVTKPESAEPVSADAANGADAKKTVIHVNPQVQTHPTTGKHGRPLKTDPYGNPVPLRKKDASLRKPEPVNLVKPADIQKPQVSFMNSIANVEPENLPQHPQPVSSTAQAYDHAVLRTEGEDDGYSPKIRRMNDSTRAKELRKRRSSADRIPYEKDTPVQTVQTLPGAKLRKRDTPQQSQETLARIPDTLKEHPLDAPAEIEYIKQAEKTQIDLSASNRPDDTDINIDIRYQNERREQTDLPKQAKKVSRSEDKSVILNDLMELKTNLSVRAAMLGLLAFLSGLLTFLDWLPKFTLPSFLSSANAPIGFLTVQLLLGLAALPFCGSLLKNGYTKLLRLRADCDSLAAMSMMSAEIAAFLILPSPNMLRTGVVSVYISVGLLSVFLNAVGKKLIAERAIRNFERLTDGNPKYGIHYVEDEKRAENLTRGTTGDFPILAAMQPVQEPEDFLKYTFSTDLADKFCRGAVPVIMVFAIAFSVFMAVVRSETVESAFCYGTSIFALCFSACACTSLALISNLPLATGTKDYVRNSGLLLGYQSVDDFFDVNTVMVDAQTLFPRGTTKLESIQVVGESRIEEALQYAASMTKHAGSILKDLFANAIVTEDKILLPVENYTYDDGKGLSGWIENKRVLLGTRDMMIEHSVEGLPVSAKEHALVKNGCEALYLAVSGTVSAMYIIKLDASGTIKHWLRELERENLFLLVRSNDALLSQRRIAKMFGFPEQMLKILPPRLEPDFVAETVPLEQSAPSMLCAGRLAGFVQTIVGAKRIRSIATLGLIIQAVTACLGLLFVLLFILLGSYHDISGGILLIYHVICTVITLMCVRMKDT